MDGLADRADRSAARGESHSARQARRFGNGCGAGHASDRAGGCIARTAERGGDAGPELAQSGAPELRIRYERPVFGLDRSENFELQAGTTGAALSRNRGPTAVHPRRAYGGRRTRGAADRLGVASSHPDFAKERSEEHTSELQSLTNLVCRLLLEKN